MDKQIKDETPYLTSIKMPTWLSDKLNKLIKERGISRRFAITKAIEEYTEKLEKDGK